MPKKDSERHTFFLSIVMKPDEGKKVMAAASRSHMKKSAWARATILRELERERKRKK